jgi:hypothetical protein
MTGMEIWYVFRGIDTKLDYKVKNYYVDVDFKQNKMQYLWLCWVKIACHYLECTIISDTKMISQPIIANFSV